MAKQEGMRHRRSNSIHVIESVISPLLDAIETKERGLSAFDVLAIGGIVVVLVSVVVMGVLIWILPTVL